MIENRRVFLNVFATRVSFSLPFSLASNVWIKIEKNVAVAVFALVWFALNPDNEDYKSAKSRNHSVKPPLDRQHKLKATNKQDV